MNAKGEVMQAPFHGGAVQEMEDGWPSGVGLRGLAPDHPVLRWLKTVVVSGGGKGVLDTSGGDREDVPERLVTGVVVEAS
jgi:hypothetical protein